MSDRDVLRPPARLESLAQWQVGKVGTIGARLTASRMPLEGRADFAVLAALEEYGSLSQADLGRRLGLDRNEINGIVGRLVVGSHVDRQTDPSDRRRNTVTITPEGVRRLDELEKIAHDVQSELLKGLDESERQQLRSLLDRVLASHGPQKS